MCVEGEGDGFGAGGRLADHCQVRCGADDAAQAGAYQGEAERAGQYQNGLTYEGGLDRCLRGGS